MKKISVQGEIYHHHKLVKRLIKALQFIKEQYPQLDDDGQKSTIDSIEELLTEFNFQDKQTDPDFTIAWDIGSPLPTQKTITLIDDKTGKSVVLHKHPDDCETSSLSKVDVEMAIRPVARCHIGDIVMINTNRDQSFTYKDIVKVIGGNYSRIEVVTSNLTQGFIAKRHLTPNPAPDNDGFKYNLYRRIFGQVVICANPSGHSQLLSLIGQEGVVINVAKVQGIWYYDLLMKYGLIIHTLQKTDFETMAGFGRYEVVKKVGQKGGLLKGDVLRLFTNDHYQMYKYERMSDGIKGSVSADIIKVAEYHEIWTAFETRFKYLINPTKK